MSQQEYSVICPFSRSEMYDVEEVESFKKVFDHFSEKELEMAILQAKKDITEELKEYQVKWTQTWLSQ